MKLAIQHHDTTRLFNLSPLLSSSSSAKDRKNVFKYYYMPILMCGAKSWTQTKADISRPIAGEMRLLGSTEGKTKRENMGKKRRERERERI
jgi:hypothetical protein